MIESSNLRATFQHIVFESKKCTACGYERPANEYLSLVLRLPFVKESLENRKHRVVGNSVQRLLEKCLHGTTDECFQCKSVSFKETCSICDHPNILAIHINRIDNSGQKCGEKIRNSRRISVSNVEYQLKCVISHLGESFNTGHYIAHRLSNEKWVEYDDLTIKHSAPEQGYVFLYERLFES